MKLQTFTKVLALGMLLCCSATAAFSQQTVKFGKVNESELTMSAYSSDTSAVAVVLSDVGYSYFTYVKDFQVVFQRHTRIKILKKGGYDWANFTVPYYQHNGDKERVAEIKGFTYNMADGKVVKDKLEGKAIFDEQTSENWYAKKISMPNVKEGSVIEISYTITSDFLRNLREWEFQEMIPVAYSEYKVRIPEYFNYKLSQQGYLMFDPASKSEKGQEHFTIRTEPTIEPGLNGGRTPATSRTLEARNETFTWIVKDAPALRPERYITTLSDYQSKIEFELQSIKFPNQLPQVMTGNWEEVTKNMIAKENFGVQLNRKGYFKSEVAAIAAKYSKPEEQMAAICELVKSTMTWNGKYGIYTSGPLRKAFENKTGSAADINLMLTAMLQEAGLDAAPVLLSTREHGRVVTAMSPMLAKFNYVVAHVVIGEKEYTLDATEPLLPPGVLPVRCLNGEGRLIKASDQRWVSLKSSAKFGKFFNGSLTINDKGEMAGTGSESSSGYSAFFLRKQIMGEGESKYTEQLNREVGNLKVEKPSILNLKSIGSPLDISYKLTSSGNGQENTVLYLNPMFGRGETENPFKLEQRLYPVDFGAPLDETIMFSYIIPAGYEVEEMPKSAIVALPENSGRFMYVVEKNDNVIQVMSKINIVKPVFYAEEYGSLKEFYNQIVAKHAEQIVLKKKAN